MQGVHIASTLHLAMNLTERLVLSYRFKPLDICIIRPSLVIGAATTPWPGYIGAPHESPAHSPLPNALGSCITLLARMQIMQCSPDTRSTAALSDALGMQGRGVASREASWAPP